MILQNKGLLLARIIMLISLSSLYGAVLAQDNNSITKIENDNEKLPWWYGQNSPRIGFAMQKAFFLELGYSRYLSRYFKSSYHYHPLHSIYSSVELGPTFYQKKESLYGVKIGYELSANKLRYSLSNIWSIGLEAKYLTNWNHHSWLILPKAGLTFSELNLFYSFNILKKNNQLDRVGNHQISLIFNLRKPYVID